VSEIVSDCVTLGWLALRLLHGKKGMLVHCMQSEEHAGASRCARLPATAVCDHCCSCCSTDQYLNITLGITGAATLTRLTLSVAKGAGTDPGPRGVSFVVFWGQNGNIASQIEMGSCLPSSAVAYDTVEWHFPAGTTLSAGVTEVVIVFMVFAPTTSETVALHSVALHGTCPTPPP
jgi:hypothetical protein